MVLINPVLEVLVPFEVRGKTRIKRDDLPRLKTTAEVVEFFKRYPQVNHRAGHPVQLQWITHDEHWAIDEYYREVGRKGWEVNGP